MDDIFFLLRSSDKRKFWKFISMRQGPRGHPALTRTIYGEKRGACKAAAPYTSRYSLFILFNLVFVTHICFTFKWDLRYREQYKYVFPIPKARRNSWSLWQLGSWSLQGSRRKKDFSKKFGASPFKYDLSIYTAFSQIHLAGPLRSDNTKWKTLFHT